MPPASVDVAQPMPGRAASRKRPTWNVATAVVVPGGDARLDLGLVLAAGALPSVSTEIRRETNSQSRATVSREICGHDVDALGRR